MSCGIDFSMVKQDMIHRITWEEVGSNKLNKKEQMSADELV